eukprot:c19605_g1_i1 orf=106-447(-)
MSKPLLTTLSKFPKTLMNKQDSHIQLPIRIVDTVQLVLICKGGTHIRSNNKRKQQTLQQHCKAQHSKTSLEHFPTEQSTWTNQPTLKCERERGYTATKRKCLVSSSMMATCSL